MSGRLFGRVAFVTIGAGTDGDALAESLARTLVGEGALVVLLARDAEAGGRMAVAVGAKAVFCPGGDAGADVSALVELASDLAGPEHSDPGSVSD